MSKLQRNPQVIWRVEKRRRQEALEALAQGDADTERGTVTLILSGMMHQLNLVGGLIWELCDGTRGEAEIAQALAGEFDVPADELAGDVAAFVGDLLERGWLSRV